MISVNCDLIDSDSAYLDLTQKSPQIQEIISERFQEVFNEQRRWDYNGKYKYETCGIDEQRLVKQIIQSSPDCKEFWAIDLGAGDFRWVDELAMRIDYDSSLPDDITVHIIGVRGEPFEDEAIKTQRCVKHKLGGFKIENLSEEFKTRLGFNLENKVHLIESEMTLMHLFDPLGAFGQAYNMLNPGLGFFLFDQFRLVYANDDFHSSSQWQSLIKGNTTQLLSDIKVPFLTQHYGDWNYFALRKPNDQPCQLPVKYHSIDYKNYPSRLVYERGAQNANPAPSLDSQSSSGGGDEGLYEWLKTNDVLTSQWQQNPFEPSKEKIEIL